MKIDDGFQESLQDVLRVRDHEILSALTVKVRFFSLRQITDTFFASDMANATRRLRTLEARGFLVQRRLIARTPPRLEAPLICWKPGQNRPDADHLSHSLKKRWERQGVRQRICYFPGPKYQALTGFPCRTSPIHQLHATHDLGLAELYLFFRSQRVTDAKQWRGENAFSCGELRKQQPDAILVDSSNQFVSAIEYGGLYNAKRLDRFHRWCQQRSLPYELW